MMTDHSKFENIYGSLIADSLHVLPDQRAGASAASPQPAQSLVPIRAIGSAAIAAETLSATRIIYTEPGQMPYPHETG